MMFQWNTDYQNYERESLLNILKPYSEKVLVIKNKNDLYNLLNLKIGK
jgi:hypothetical protein